MYLLVWRVYTLFCSIYQVLAIIRETRFRRHQVRELRNKLNSECYAKLEKLSFPVHSPQDTIYPSTTKKEMGNNGQLQPHTNDGREITTELELSCSASSRNYRNLRQD